MCIPNNFFIAEGIAFFFLGLSYKCLFFVKIFNYTFDIKINSFTFFVFSIISSNLSVLLYFFANLE